MKVYSAKECLCFRTVTPTGKSPHRFYILRSQLQRLAGDSSVIVRDIHSFAELRRDRNRVTIQFTWMEKLGDLLNGWEQMVVLPYDALMRFVEQSGEDDTVMVWKVISIEDKRRPRITFLSTKNLKEVLGDKLIRHRLVRYLRDHSFGGIADEVIFTDESIPYSFFFYEYKGDQPILHGGLILHRQEDLDKAYYSIHT